MWASMASWFTPTVLFCFLNLMIGTIFITSNLKTHGKQQKPEVHGNDPPQLVRAPSLFERVRSINFSIYGSDQYPDPFQHESHREEEHDPPPQLVRAPSILERVRSINFSPYRSERPDPVNPDYADPTRKEPPIGDHHVIRSKPDKSAPARITKSASEKLLAVEAEDVDRRRPATVRERSKAAASGEEEEVDSKADDFINRFKQQLKLQRLDSLLRYREMLNRGAGK